MRKIVCVFMTHYSTSALKAHANTPRIKRQQYSF